MKTRISAKKTRQKRIRRRIIGSLERPRLAVFRSLEHIYAQIIDDAKGVTIVSASDFEIDKKDKKPIDITTLVGELVAKKAREKKITKVVYDRSGYQYHGHIKALAEGARKGGLEF